MRSLVYVEALQPQPGAVVLNRKGCGQVSVVQVGTVVGVKVDKLRTVLKDDGDDGVLDHLPELDVLERLEAGSGDLPGNVVAGVPH